MAAAEIWVLVTLKINLVYFQKVWTQSVKSTLWNIILESVGGTKPHYGTRTASLGCVNETSGAGPTDATNVEGFIAGSGERGRTYIFMMMKKGDTIKKFCAKNVTRYLNERNQNKFGVFFKKQNDCVSV
jgi:hypothetical protein